MGTSTMVPGDSEQIWKQGCGWGVKTEVQGDRDAAWSLLQQAHPTQGFNRRLDGWMHGDLLTLESEDQQAMGKDGLEASVLFCGSLTSRENAGSPFSAPHLPLPTTLCGCNSF